MADFLGRLEAGGPKSIVIATFCLLASVIFLIIRRAYFHPLSQIPGPFFASVSNAYSAYYSWAGTMHLDVQRCHQKYDDIIRYGPNRILSLYHADMSAFYGHGRPFRKSRGYETMISFPDGWSTMTSIDKDMHHALRRTFRAGVGSETLAHFEPAILLNLGVYFSELTRVKDTEGWSTAKDMRAWNLYLGFDTMADFGLGLKTDLLRSSAREYVFPALHVHQKKMGLWEQWIVLNDIGLGYIVSQCLLMFSSKAKIFSKWYQRFSEEAVSNNSSEIRGIFGPAIQSGLGKSEKPGHTQAQMIAEGAFSTFSSADAYGMMLCGFQHYLSHYPYVYEKLAMELRGRFKPGQKIMWGPELESIAYLRAIVDEIMRMLPPVCGVHWRECEESDVTIGKDKTPLPVGSDVGVSLFATFRDGRIFRNPVQFWPERWLPGTLPEAEYNRAKKMFTPFLIGPRNCAGGHVAIMIASISFAHLLVNYNFRLGPDQERTSSQLWSNTPKEPGSESELVFESHYSIAGWEKGPFIEFRARPPHSSPQL